MAGCNCCGATEVKLAENKPYIVQTAQPIVKGNAQFVTSHILI